MAASKKKRDTLYRKKFNLALNQYEFLLLIQNNVCYICHKTDIKNEFLAVDHNHSTGLVRGLLCRDCNRALGQFKDNTEYLKRAIEYLLRDPPILPNPIDIPNKPHSERPRHRTIINTPEGIFKSMESAAKYYKVDSTTIRGWCGLNTNSPGSRKDGFTYRKIFGTKDDI